MAVFEYQALNARGRKTKGMIDADSERAARSRLKQQGIFPTSLIETRDQATTAKASGGTVLRSNRVSVQQLAVATRQLGTLIGAGIPLVEALRALSDQLDSQNLKRVFAEVCDRVNEGSTFANAMRDHPKIFPKLYVNMVASGEASGSLEVVMERLADLLESQADLRRQVVSAAVYPALMLVLCFGVIVLLLAYVVPEITAIFAERKAILPLPTRIVIALSKFTQQYYPVVIGVMVLGGLVFSRYRQTESGRERLDAMKLRLPIVGPIAIKVATARFARTLGTMLTSGIELLTALSIVKNIIGNVILEHAVEAAAIGVREGKSLAPELGKAAVFPKLLIHMITVGERSGQLESMLIRAAASYESEVNAVISSLTKILEPVLILVIAGIVAVILASVMLPMLEMTSLATA